MCLPFPKGKKRVVLGTSSPANTVHSHKTAHKQASLPRRSTPKEHSTTRSENPHRYHVVPPIMIPEQLFRNDPEHVLPLLFRYRLVTPERGNHVFNGVSIVPVHQLRQHPRSRVISGVIGRDNAYFFPASSARETQQEKPCAVRFGV